MNLQRLPQALIGVGILFVAIILGEVVASFRLQGGVDPVGFVNFIASLPFIAILVGGGYWLSRSDLPPDRYRRLVAWVLAGFVFLGGFFLFLAAATSADLVTGIGMVRWGAAAGAGSGTLVGIFEARAVERAINSEQIRIRNEALRQKNEQLEEFAGILTHDLRNPLNVASGYVELLQDDYEDDRLDKIETSHERIHQIIQQTLTLARSGHVVEDPQPVPLTDLVNQCWQNVPTEDATLTTDAIGSIVADPNRVQQLFENLFRNAIEHGGSDVTVRIGMLSDGFYVEDDGPGIPEEDRETILQSGYTTNEKGSGFGLAIVRQIAEAHRWKITITDGTDGGARFEFTRVEIEPHSGNTTKAPLSK